MVEHLTNTRYVVFSFNLSPVCPFNNSLCVFQLYVKLHCEDAAMLEHTEQLLGELGGELVADDDGDETGPSIDDIGDDFIQSSEDEEDDDAMEH